LMSLPSRFVSFTSQLSHSGDFYFGRSRDLLYGLVVRGSPCPTMKTS
jgi:hypothetical protein